MSSLNYKLKNGSTSSSARKKEKFQRIFFRVLNDIYCCCTWFFAENIKENITEHYKAKKLSESRINDLALVTSQLIQTVDTIEWRNKKLGTLMEILNEPVKQLYYYSKLTDNQFL